MTDEQRLAEAREWMAETMQASEIRKAKTLLENSGYSVLLWQTGLPVDGKRILICINENKIEWYEVAKYENCEQQFWNLHRVFDKSLVKRWAYLPEGEQK